MPPEEALFENAFPGVMICAEDISQAGILAFQFGAPANVIN